MTAWRRLATRVRALVRSLRRRAHSLITAAWSSFVTSDRRFARRAATATERASLGSFLLTSPLSSRPRPGSQLGRDVHAPSRRRRRAAGRAGNRAPGRSPRPRCVSGHALAHSVKPRQLLRPERTRNWPRTASCSSRATAVCEP